MGFALVVVFVTVVLILLVTGQARASSRNETYRELARRYQGRFEAGGWFSKARVHFRHQGVGVTIDVVSAGDEHQTTYTRASFKWHYQTARVEVYPAGIWLRLGTMLGRENLTLGDPLFDSCFLVKSDDPPAARSLLNPLVRLAIERLYQLLGNRDIYIQFAQGTLQIKKRSLISSLQPLDEFVRRSIELYDQAVATFAVGIEFVANTEPPKADETACQICGDPIITDVVVCRSCRTPHHEDCWQYNGACSTYGCQEKRYYRPSSAGRRVSNRSAER